MLEPAEHLLILVSLCPSGQSPPNVGHPISRTFTYIPDHLSTGRMFLDMPQELRFVVYEILLDLNAKAYILIEPLPAKMTPMTNLLWSSRQIRADIHVPHQSPDHGWRSARLDSAALLPAQGP